MVRIGAIHAGCVEGMDVMGRKAKHRPVEKDFDLAKFVEAAFREGYNSYETSCCAFNNEDSAWLKSAARSELLAHLAKCAQP